MPTLPQPGLTTGVRLGLRRLITGLVRAVGTNADITIIALCHVVDQSPVTVGV